MTHPATKHLPQLLDYLVQQYQCNLVIDLNMGHVASNSKYPVRSYNLNQPQNKLSTRKLSKSVIACVNQLHSLADPANLLKQIKLWMDDAPIGIITTPDCKRAGAGRWTLSEFRDLLFQAGLHIEFTGYTVGESGDKDTCIAILTNNKLPPIQTAPDDFRVVVILTCYNEIDIITDVLTYLIGQGLYIHVVDNWSDDGTYEAAENLLGEGVVGVERYPIEKPKVRVFNLEDHVRNVGLVSERIAADWYIHYDTDEIRQSPWRDVILKDAIYYLDQCGYNSFNHWRLDFQPIDDRFRQGDSLLESFDHYAFGKKSGDYIQVKGWKNIGQKPQLPRSLGHRVEFEKQRIYPFRFITRHYIFRSKAQMIMKLSNRKRDVDPVEVAKGFRQQYAQHNPEDEAVFDTLCQQTKATFSVFDDETFYDDFLLERLAGIGLSRNKKPMWKILRSTILRYLTHFLRKFSHDT